MRYNKIGLKLGLWILLLHAIVIFSAGLVIDRLFTGFYYNQMKEDANELSSHFSNMAGAHEANADHMMFSFAEFSKVNIYLLTSKGQFIARSEQLSIKDERFLTEEELQQVSAGEAVQKPYKDASGKQYFVSAERIREGAHADTVVAVLSSLQHMEESIAQVRQLLLLSGLGAFFLAVAFTYIVSNTLSRPLIRMEQATRSIAKGELETRLSIASHDEVGNLAQSINDLAAELQQYRDSRQQFFANISHELRTPVTYLEGYAKVLNDGLYETEEERNQYIDIIYQESIRMKHLIHDLFELAIMEEGKYSFQWEWIDLREVVESAVSKVRLKAGDKGITLGVRMTEEAVPLYADGYRVEQILLNLLENAIRYTEQGGVEVVLHKGQGAVQLEVRDTGIGIPQEEIPFLFDRFYRVEKSRSRQYGGTGLGLSIVKKLVELQGGAIRVDSEVGKGTVISIRFTV